MTEAPAVSKELLAEKINEAKKVSKQRNFEQSVELIISLDNLDLKKPENRVLITVPLPKIPKKSRTVCVFADGPLVDIAKEAGADRVITKSELEQLAGRKREIKKIANKYDFFLAQPQLMSLVGRYFGFALGPRGKMPTVVTSPEGLKGGVESLKRSVRINLRKNPEAECAIGNETMDVGDLAENALAVINEIYNKTRDKARIGRIYVKLTMGPAIRVI